MSAFFVIPAARSWRFVAPKTGYDPRNLVRTPRFVFVVQTASGDFERPKPCYLEAPMAEDHPTLGRKY